MLKKGVPSVLHKLSRKTNNALGGFLQHVVTVPAGDGDEGDGLGVVTDLLDESGRLLDDFVETILGPLNGLRHRLDCDLDKGAGSINLSKR